MSFAPTSKPLLTAIYGLLYSLTGDWRSISWAAIGAFALCVVLGALLAYRVSGPLSGSFVAVGFLLSPVLLRDISLAYALSWAVLTWIVAGLAVVGTRPRYGLAGVALVLGALARPETLTIPLVAGGTLLAAEIWTRARNRPAPPRTAYLTLIGFLAIPVLAGHDWVIAGDPLLWMNTAQNNSDGAGNVRAFLAMVGFVGRYVLGLAPLLPLAALGGIMLGLRRQWSLGVGLVAASVGVAVFWILVGTRGTVVASRYLAPIDLSLVFAAGLGLSVLDVPTVRRWLATRARIDARRAGTAALAGTLAALAFTPIWPLDRDVLAGVSTQRQLHENAQRAFDAILEELNSTGLSAGGSLSAGSPPSPAVLVPPRLRAQAVVDLGLPLTVVRKSWASGIDPAAGRPVPGSIIYHDRLDDKASLRWATIEIDQPVVIGSLRLVPILSDPGRGFWVIRVEDATPP